MNSSIAGVDDVLGDLAMLQHTLIRVLSLSVLPGFLRSFNYSEALLELRQDKKKGPMHEIVEAELEAVTTEVSNSVSCKCPCDPCSHPPCFLV